MNDGIFSVLLDPALWGLGVERGFWQRIVEHLGYTALALALALLVALPVGLVIGHTNRFAFLAINLGNASRSLPTLGLIAIIVVLFGVGLLPITVALAPAAEGSGGPCRPSPAEPGAGGRGARALARASRPGEPGVGPARVPAEHG